MAERPDLPETDPGPETTRGTPVFSPATDIYETDSGLVMTLELPGVEIENVDVKLDKRVLTVTARGHTEQPTGYTLSRREFADGDYERAFSLSENIDAEDISAAMKDGVLTLVLKKAGPPKEKRIQVRQG